MPRLQDWRRPARGLSPVVHPAMGIATRHEHVAQYRPPVHAPRTLRMPDGISRRGPLKVETRVRSPMLDSPWERQRRALLFLPPADSSPIPGEGIFMLRISAIIAVVSLVGFAAIGISSAQAQQLPGKNSCSLDACVATCNKRGTVRSCDRYCERDMARRGCR